MPTRMRKITPAEKKAWKLELEQRQTPEDMARRWNAFHVEIGAEMLVQAGVEFMRDAYVAHRFAAHRQADAVWLVDQIRPDFGVQLAHAEFLFEVTEADWPDRRRSDEYKKHIIPKLRAGTPTVEEDPNRFRMTPEQAVALLQHAALEKVSGNYDIDWGLVILLQPRSWPSVVGGVEAVLASGTEVAKEAFREVWVDWGATFYLVWRDGRPVPR
jgi:hypothetical protein